MAKRRDKIADKVQDMYRLVKYNNRSQWEYINQKGFDFSNDNQLSEEERLGLEEQGMPTFTINRITPVVEMLNFYATAQNPRWQAIGVEGSDTDVASVVSDLTDYVWANSNGSTIYSNAANDAITKGVGYLLVSVDKDADNGLGEVVVQQPEPFDVYIDPKSRDMLFSDAAFVMIRKVLPKNHLMKLFPDSKRKISNASNDAGTQGTYSNRPVGDIDQKLFAFNDNNEQSSMGITPEGEQDQLCEFFEVYEKIKISYISLFYRVPPNKEQLAQIKKQCEVQVMEMTKELQVQL